MRTLRFFAVLLILLGGGCVSKRPLGTDTVISRCFDPTLRSFLDDVRISSFDNEDSNTVGYYFPILGVHVAEEEVGHCEFEGTMTHELLHAVHFNGGVDKDLFARMLQRLLHDSSQADMVKQVHALPWNNLATKIFRQSEYFVRIGEAIIARRGYGIPDYVLEPYRGILHPNLWLNAHTFACSPTPVLARVECVDGTILESGSLMGHALRLYSKNDRIAPRQDVARFTVWLDIPFDDRLVSPAAITWRRRSTHQTIASGTAHPLVSGENRRLECVWDLAQARAILQAHLDMDLDIEIFDPMIAFHRR